MTNNPRSNSSGRAGGRNPKERNTGARALMAALALSATLGGWALIVRDAQPASPTIAGAAGGSADGLRLEPLPTVEPLPGNFSEITSSQFAPADSPALQAAPIFTLPRGTMLKPLARSRSSN